MAFYASGWAYYRSCESVEQIADEIRERHQLEPGDEACLYSGLGDWKAVGDPYAYYCLIQKVLGAVRSTGAAPVLFATCSCCKQKKIELALLAKMEFRCLWTPEDGWMSEKRETYGSPSMF